MSALPAELSTGMVHGRFIVAMIDGDDGDQEPDVIPASGKIVFKAGVPYVPVPATSEGPVTVLKGPITGVLDSEGYLCTPHPVTGKPMYLGVKLLATDDPDMAVTEWTWTAEYRFDSVGAVTLAIPAHSFSLPSGAAVDLTTMVKVPSSPGYGLPQAEAAVLRAEVAAASSAEDAALAASAADRAELVAGATDAGVAILLSDAGTDTGALFEAGLATKADTADMNTALALKADKAAVEDELALKADLSSTTAAIYGKVSKGELFVNAADYGALPNGSDATAALNEAASAAYSLSPDAVLMITRGNYTISGPVNVKCALAASQATLNYSGVGDALIIGNVESPGIVTSRRMYILPRVVRVGANSYDGSSRGVRLVNLNSCIVTSQFIQHFEEGLVFEGYAQGFVHNIIYPGTLWGNRRNIVLRKGTTGWCNDNLIIGGRLSGPTWGFADDPLSNFILFEDQGELGSPNSNKFYGTSLEGANTHLYRVDLAGNYNVFDYCRWEHGADQTVRIRYRTNANYTELNGGYMQQLVQEVFDGPTIGNKRTVQSNAIYSRTNSLNATTLQNAVYTDITTWVPPTGFYFTYNAATGEVTPRPGRYLVRAKISFSASIAAGSQTVRILKGSAIQSVVTVAGKVSTHSVEVSDTITFNGTETFKIQAFQDSGQTCNLTVGAGYALLSAELIQ